MLSITETRQIPVIDEVDICVVGGSCTGVFAAIRAARLGAKVAIIEKNNCFGGSATNGLVCIWHTLKDINFDKQVIAGLTQEVINRLKKRKYAIEEHLNATPPARLTNNLSYYINTEELKIELDEMITEAGVHPYLHTLYSAPYIEGDKLKGIIFENKSGRQCILAKQVIDATADGDVCVHLGLESYVSKHIQPSTTCAKLYMPDVCQPEKLFGKYKNEFGLSDCGYSLAIPGSDEVVFWARTNISENCCSGTGLTKAEIEGRRQLRAHMDLLRKYAENGEELVLMDCGAQIGIRETRHIRCLYQLKRDDILYGKHFDDAIAYGSYPSDIHYNDSTKVSYFYLDGVREDRGDNPGATYWKETDRDKVTYWQIPLRSLIPPQYDNLLVCGRAIDADEGAFGAVRVMISMNQTGEAAGVAAFVALNSKKAVQEIDSSKVRKLLKDGNSIIF